MTNLTAFPGAGPVEVAEPVWSALISDELDARDASDAWRAAVADMRDAGTLSPGNAAALRRYALTVALHSQAARRVFDQGAVTTKGKAAVQMWNLWTSALEKAAAMCESIEAELGLSPRRRAAVAPAKRNTRKATAADAFLGAKKA